MHIDNLYDDDKAIALERTSEGFKDAKASAVDHIRVARKTVADEGPMGLAFKNIADQLLEAEGDLSLAEGALS